MRKDCHKECGKNIKLYLTFYLDEKDIKSDPKGEVQFRMTANIV